VVDFWYDDFPAALKSPVIIHFSLDGGQRKWVPSAFISAASAQFSNAAKIVER